MKQQTTQSFVSTSNLDKNINRYTTNLSRILKEFDWSPVHSLAQDLLNCWKNGKQLFICGNGGSAANAIHIANDCLYGISKVPGQALRCHALSSNSSVITCLANDTGYDKIFATQLDVLANPEDVLLVLSGSGNSSNILEAIKTAESKNIKSYGIFGYSGGIAKNIVDTPIHFDIDDMQISEDLQMIVAHIISQWLYENRQLVLG